jgi:hypothetical protein
VKLRFLESSVWLAKPELLACLVLLVSLRCLVPIVLRVSLEFLVSRVSRESRRVSELSLS